jgi:hypothetical protein
MFVGAGGGLSVERSVVAVAADATLIISAARPKQKRVTPREERLT